MTIERKIYKCVVRLVETNEPSRLLLVNDTLRVVNKNSYIDLSNEFSKHYNIELYNDELGIIATSDITKKVKHISMDYLIHYVEFYNKKEPLEVALYNPFNIEFGSTDYQYMV